MTSRLLPCAAITWLIILSFAIPPHLATAQMPNLYSHLTPVAALLNPDGTLDTSTGYRGAVDVRGYRMTTTAMGAPRFIPAAAIATADDDGNWDDRFGMPGMSFDAIHALLVDGTDVYAAGWFTEAAALPATNIARWDGRRWWPLGDGVDGTAHALARYKGEIYVAGILRKAGDVLANGIARWDGTTWKTVGDGFVGEFGDPTVYALAVFKDELYAGGDFIEASGTAAVGIARWDGTAWRDVGGGVKSQPYDNNADVHALAASDNALYVGGDFDQAGTVEAAAVAVWDGSAWAALGMGIEGEFAADVKALSVQGTKVYAGGSFNKAGGVAANNVAVWDTGAKSWSALGQGVRGEFDAGEVNAVLPIGTSLYVAGNFAFAGSAAAKHVAVWDGSAWSGLVQNGENGTDFPALALAPDPGGSAIIAGDFEWAGGLYVNRITRWDGSRFFMYGEGLSTGSDFPPTINAVAVAADGKVYVGGQFSYAGSAVAENVAMWDGTAWHGMGSGTDGIVFSLTTKGDDVYVGGRFTQAGGIGASHIARWNATTQSWHALGSGINGWIYALAVDGDRVYAGGDFTAAGGVPAEDIAAWDGTAWSVLSSKITFNPNGVIYAIQPDGDFVWIGGDILSVRVNTGYVEVNGILALKKSTDELFEVAGGVTRRASSDVWGTVYALAIADGALYVGGKFDKAGGQVAANGVARYDGKAWAALGSSVGGEFTQQVNALAVHGTNVYVGGQFESAGGATSRAVAQWNTATQSWTGLGQGLSSGSEEDFAVAKALATHDDKLYAGGVFEQASGQPASAFAQWNITGPPPPTQATLRLDPTRITFAELAPGQSVDQTITITNTSPAATLTGAVAAPAAPFSLVSGGGDFSLGPNASHAVTVRFAPTAEGTFAGAISITHNAGNTTSPATVALGGSATSQSATTTLRSFDPSGEGVVVFSGDDIETGGGVFGPNQYGDRAKAMLFTLPAGTTSAQLTSVRAWFGYKKDGLAAQIYTLAIYDGTAADGPSGAPRHTQTYRLADVVGDADPSTAPQPTTYALEAPVTVDTTFFVVFDFGDYGQGDIGNVALVSTNALGRRVPEVWEAWQDSSWHNVSDAWKGSDSAPGSGTDGWHPWIEATVTTGTPTGNEPKTPSAAFAPEAARPTRSADGS